MLHCRLASQNRISRRNIWNWRSNWVPKAAEYLKVGSGKFVRTYRGELVEGRNNDITQTIEIRILSEEELAYKEALDYIPKLQLQVEHFFKNTPEVPLSSVRRSA